MCMNSHAHYTCMSLLEEECAEERKSAEELPVLDKTGGETVTCLIYHDRDYSLLSVPK